MPLYLQLSLRSGAPKAAGKKPSAKGKSSGAPTSALALAKQRLEIQKKHDEEVKRQQEEEEARIREEERKLREQEALEKIEREAAEAKKKADMEAKKVEQKHAVKNTAMSQLRGNENYILPDLEAIEEAKKNAGKQELAGKTQTKKKPQPGGATSSIEPAKKVKSESDVSSDEDVPPEDEEIDDWELMDELQQKRDAVISRNTKRAERREERIARKQKEEDERQAQYEAECKESSSVLEMRSPICCVLGHVDTGKTSLLDRIRRTNVQGGEAGGITQQIGATFFPHEALVAATEELNKKQHHELKVPGLLVIDTPGHESFTNLRSRGSTLCDIAVLVIDIMHGLEPQTRESIKLLRDRKCPFIVALNKVDRCLDWEAHENMDIEETLSKQKAHTQQEFESRAAQILTELNEEGYNAELYWRNKKVRSYVNVVPTSAKTGEGISDLLLLKVQLVQQFMSGKVAFKNDLQCTVLEVKPVQGLGNTIDVVLVNGTLNEGDKIVLCGMNGPVETQIRSLLTPQPLRELRVKSEYVHHKSIRAAMGVKIAAQDLDEVVPGTQLYVWRTEEEREKARKDVMSDLTSILKQIDRSGVGVTVQSSTLGALEALLSFLKDSNIPVASIALGPLHKKHLQHTLAMRARQPRFGIVLAFDVTVSKEAKEFAEKEKIPVFEAKIIYHLFDMFEKYMEKCDQDQMKKDEQVAVFPVELNQLASIRDRPMILQATVARGHLHTGTPLCTLIDGGNMKLAIGTVVSIQRDSKDIKTASPGMTVAFKVNPAVSSLHFGRQFGEKNILYSDLTRESIDALKSSFLKQVPPEDWDLVRALKPLLGIGGPTKSLTATAASH